MANKKNTKSAKTTTKKTKVVAKKKEIKEEIEDFEEELDEVEEKRESKKTTSKKSSLKTLIIVAVCILAFVGISFILPGDPVEKENETEKEGPSLTEWSEVVKKDEVLTVIGSTTCPHCQEYKPVINKLASEHGFKLYFFELENLSQDEKNILISTFELKNFDGGVPYSFIVRDGKFVSDTVGFADEESIVEFLKTNKIIK